jgi:hypothetical protein
MGSITPAQQPPAPAKPTAGPPPVPKGPIQALDFPIDPPDQRLVKAGFSAGGIRELNSRVAKVVGLHQKAYGVPPSPGMVLDFVRSNVPPSAWGQMFTPAARDAKQAQLGAAANAAPATPPVSNPTIHPGDAVEGAARALRNGTLNDYLVQHGDAVAKELETKDHQQLFLKTVTAGPGTPAVVEEAAQAARAGQLSDWVKDHPVDAQQLMKSPEAQKQLSELVDKQTQADIGNHIQEAALVPGFKTAPDLLGRIAGDVINGYLQVAGGLALGPPELAYQEGKAAVESAKQQSPKPLEQTNVKLAKGIVAGTKQDFAHPEANVGNLALDILALGSAGAGTVARISAATRAEGLSGVVGALVHRPYPGTYTFHKNAANVDVLLSDNALVRTGQKMVNNLRQRKLWSGTPSASLEPVVNEAEAHDLVDRATHPLGGQFTIDQKLGREMRAQRRVEQAIRDAVLDPAVFATKSAVRTHLFDRIVPGLRKTLTAGEQKLIQTVLTDVEGPAKTQIETWREFHQNAIDSGIGDEQAHRNQLNLLDQAEKVAAKKPSRALSRALDATRRVIDLQEAIKGEQMGLVPETAEGRVARVGQIVRGESTEGKVARVNPESRYLPFTSSVRHKPAGTAFTPRPGPYGIPVPSSDPSMTHEFTGHYIKTGDFRTDATALAAEAYQRTVRTLMVANQYRFLHDASDATKLTADHIPIRDTRDIPDALRRVLSRSNGGDVAHEDAAALAKQDWEALQKHLYPNETDLSKEELDHVRWIDKALLGDAPRLERPSQPNLAKKGAIAANELLRDATIYFRPSYIMMMLNAGQMALMEEGFTFPANLYRAFHAGKIYGDEEARVLHAMAGAGRAKSYYSTLPGALEKLTAPGRNMSALWHKVAEQTLRTSAVIYWLHRSGLSDAEIGDVLRGAHTDPEAMSTLVEAGRRGRKAMVEFDNLTYYEREVFKHMLFVYPWLRGTAVWSLRTLLEHPIQSAAFAHVGEQTEQQFDPILKRLPGYLKDQGVFPIGWTGDGKPKIVNAGTYNSYSVLAQIGGLLTDRSSSLENLLGPGAQLAVHTLTGRDQYGRQYKNRFVGPLIDQLAQLPQFRIANQAATKANPSAPLDLASIDGLIRQENAAAKGPNKQPVLMPPGFLDGYGALVLSGLADRVVNPEAVNAKYWAAQPLEARNAHEQKLIQEMIGIQARVLGTTAPKAVRTAGELASAFSLAYGEYHQSHGHEPTLAEKTLLDIGVLEGRKLISASVAARLRSQLEGLPPADVEMFRSGVHRVYAYGKQLTTWTDDVKTYTQVTNPQLLNYQLRQAAKYKIADGPTNAPPAVLEQYARGYVKYVQAQRTRVERLKDMSPADAEAQKLEIEADAAKADVPVKINGYTLPSYPRLSVARMSPTALKSHMTAVASESWDTLSSLDKQLLGRNVGAGVAQAWAAYKYDTSKTGLAKQPPGQRTLDAAQKLAVVKQLDADYKLGGAFVRDYLYAQQPRFQRYQHEPIYQQSANKSLWQDIFQQAATLYNAHKAGDISQSQMDDAWASWTSQVEPIIKQKYPAFWHELQPYMKHSPNFLSDLVKR